MAAPRITRPGSRVANLLVALVLAATVGSWAHGAVHAAHADENDSCATCQWVRHSVLVVVPTVVLAVIVIALGRADVAAPPLFAHRAPAAASVRGPPRDRA